MSIEYSRGFERKRREVKADFRKNHNVNSYEEVREYLREAIPNFEEAYSHFDNILRDWHKVRLQISMLDFNKDFIPKSFQIRKSFVEKYQNPKSKDYLDGLSERLNPVLHEITNLVSANKNQIIFTAH